jgi:eukaryotic-like serine/threonine-protein kinase
MSPEQVTGRDLDARSDLFTVGIVLAELVTIRPLFSGGTELDVLFRIRDADLTSLERASASVPEDVRQLLFRALAKEPALRYASAAAFAEAIEEVIRRRRLQVGPAKLAAWVERLGLAQGPEVAGEQDEETCERLTAPIDIEAAERQSLREAERSTGSGSSSGAGKDDTQDEERPSSSQREVAPNIYRVRFTDGAEVGPLSYPRLVELFATGRIHVGSLIARESAEFKDPATFPELHRFVSSPALRWEPGMPKDAIDTGPIDRVLLPSRLFHVAVRRETGLLVLNDGIKRKKIYIVDGVPEFIASTEKSELLGEHLIARGQVLRMEIDMALAMLPRFGGRLGDALVGLGVLRPIELFRAIHEQTQARYVEIFSWRRGEIGFVRGVRSHEETFPLGVDPFELVARGVRENYPAAELEAILSPLEEEVIEPVVPLPVRIETFRLPEREAHVLMSVDGKSTLPLLVAQMSKSGAADPEEVLRAVFLGLSCEVLRSHRWNAFTSTAPAPTRGSERKIPVR